MANVQCSLDPEATETSTSAPHQAPREVPLPPRSALPWFLRFFSCLASSSAFALAVPSVESGHCCYGGQGSENKAIFFPTANRSQRRLYVQTHLIKGLPPLAIRAVVTNRSGFLATVYSGVPQWKQSRHRKVLMCVKFKCKSDSAERLFTRCLKMYWDWDAFYLIHTYRHVPDVHYGVHPAYAVWCVQHSWTASGSSWELPPHPENQDLQFHKIPGWFTHTWRLEKPCSRQYLWPWSQTLQIQGGQK